MSAAPLQAKPPNRKTSMPKPPASPPSSDLEGVHRDRAHRLSPRTFDAKAQAQLAAENRENVGRPDQDEADQPKDDPNIGVGN
jgi:hypothetical protein